jgi:tetratricopeptide (TPR) repeat protein
MFHGFMLLRARRYDDGIDHGRKMLGLTDIPGAAGVGHFILGLAFDLKGASAQAVEELQQALPWPEGQRDRVAALAHAFAVSGRKGEALKELGILQKMPASPELSYEMAVVYTGLSERDRAFEWLDKAYDERDYSLSLIKADPRMDPLHSDPRYAELMRRMGLPE